MYTRAFRIALLLLLAAPALVSARTVIQDTSVLPGPDESPYDIPAAAPGNFTRGDTLSFGYYTMVGGNYYAVLGESWTWDHDPGPGPVYNREGWYAVDMTDNPAAYFKRITTSVWSGHQNQVAAPIGHGTASAWVGLFEDEAGDLCWSAGLGYGNLWCQQFRSPFLRYSGSGDVNLSFYYFNDTELNYDYSKIYVVAPPAEPYLLNMPGFTDKIGVQYGPQPPVPQYQQYSRVIHQDELGGTGTPMDVAFYFELKADGGWSDEDGGYATAYGPFGVDDIQIGGGGLNATYDFESGLQGWTAVKCQGLGSYFSIQPLSQYNILDPCACALSGMVAAFHDGDFHHPTGQYVQAFSPPVRKAIEAPYPTWNKIFCDWDTYVELPQVDGVNYRPGYYYYPYICPSTGQTQWSGRQGQAKFFFTGDTPDCRRTRSIGTDWGIPPDCQAVGFVFEVYASCDAFNQHPCSGFSNFTPIIDNVRLRFTGVPNAPVVNYDDGTQFQDNFNRGSALDVMGVGNADITYDLHRDPPPDLPDYLGDSLEVSGAVPGTNTSYLTRLWYRVRREGPGQIHIPRYRTWKAKVADGINFVGETRPNKGRNFAFGWMDSVEIGTRIAINKFCSQFHEMDDDFTPPEQGEDNEIIWDNMLTPGTKIEYFVTANYSCTPNQNYLLPDTTGQFYSEFEILPSYRNVSGGLYRLPCVLYVDAYNGGVQYYVENALNVVLNGANVGDPIPDPTSWDRYDYFDAASNWCAPMFRNTGGTSGGSLAEFLGYRMIMTNTGNYPTGTMRDRDWQGISQWLTAVDCFGGSQPRQGFWASGDNIAMLIDGEVPGFLQTYCGAFFDCDANWDVGCPTTEDPARNDTLYCTKIRPASGCAFVPSFALDLYGNWCPAKYSFDVLGTASGGCGNKNYQRWSDNYYTSTRYAQVANDAGGSASNYRTVLDGYSVHHLIRPDVGQGVPGECLLDTTRVVQASLDEIRNIIRWTLGLADPSTLSELCVDPCLNVTGPPSDVEPWGNERVNRLYQNSPNPFNPHTTIRFSLAQKGPATLDIFDVGGRRVRTLAQGVLEAGLHEVVWDGTDDAGRLISSGVFWSQLKAGGYVSSKKMVVLK